MNIPNKNFFFIPIVPFDDNYVHASIFSTKATPTHAKSRLRSFDIKIKYYLKSISTRLESISWVELRYDHLHVSTNNNCMLVIKRERFQSITGSLSLLSGRESSLVRFRRIWETCFTTISLPSANT